MTLDEILAYYASKNTRPISDARRETLAIAVERGADDAALKTLADAPRIHRGPTIVLPRQHLESLSHGRGWARQGRGDHAEWGLQVKGGYRVGPGSWIVGATDGFRRRCEGTWTVKHVRVGSDVWTVAR